MLNAFKIPNEKKKKGRQVKASTFECRPEKKTNENDYNNEQSFHW